MAGPEAVGELRVKGCMANHLRAKSGGAAQVTHHDIDMSMNLETAPANRTWKPHMETRLCKTRHPTHRDELMTGLFLSAGLCGYQVY